MSALDVLGFAGGLVVAGFLLGIGFLGAVELWDAFDEWLGRDWSSRR